MSIIEFQVGSTVFIAAQLNALRALPLCRKTPIVVGGMQILIDKIEFGDNSELRHNVATTFSVFFASETSTAPGISVDGLQTQLAQEVTVYLTTYSDIVSHPNQPPDLLFPVTGTLVFNLDFYALDTECYLRSELVGLEPALLGELPPGLPVDPTDLVKQAEQYLRSLIPATTVPAGLAPLASMWAHFVNAGVSVDSNKQRIAFRAQIGGDNDSALQPWKDFFNGIVYDRLGGSDWGAYIDSGLLTEWLKAKVNAQVGSLGVDNLQLFVGCNYSNADAAATFTLDVEAVYDLPGPLGDVTRDPKVVMTLSVDGLNTLKLLVDYSDVIGVIHSFDIVEFALPSVSDAIEGLLQFVIGLELADLNKGDNPPFCTKIGSALIQCKKSVRMPQIATGTSGSLDELLALQDGISFVGSLRSSNLTPALLSTDFGNFVWAPPRISCGESSRDTVEDFRQHAATRAHLRAEVHLQHTGTTPVDICGPPTVLNDPLGLYPATAITLDQTRLPATYVITLAPPGPSYPLDLLVSTTAGTRLVRIPPPPPITAAIIDFLTNALKVQLAICNVTLNPWFGGDRVFDVNWIVDPLVDPSPEFTVEHLWNVEIAGLASGDRVTALALSGERLMTAVAPAGAPVRISALVPPGGAADFRLALAKAAPAQPTVGGAVSFESRTLASPASPGVELRQQGLLRARSLALKGFCRSIVAFTNSGSPGVAVILKDEIVAFDLRNPFAPTRAGSWLVEGVRGACRWRNQLLVFGANGLFTIDAAARRIALGTACELRSILDVSVGRSVIYALTDESLDIRSNQACLVSALPVCRGRALLTVGPRLFVGGRNGVSVYDVTDECKPCFIASTESMEVTQMSMSPDGPAGSIVAVLSDGSARSFALAHGALSETARYDRVPWFLNNLRMGRVLVRLGEAQQELIIAVLGESRLVVPSGR